MEGDLAEDFESGDQTSFELWSDINERFGQSNGPLVHQLKKELAALKQENLSILSYYSKIKNMWDELQSLRKLPVCTCGALAKCLCGYVKKLDDLEFEDKLMQCLLGLNQAYDNTVTNILSMEPLLNINKAYSITLQIEAQTEVVVDVDVLGGNVVLAVQKYNRNGMSKIPSRTYVAGQNKEWKKDWKQDWNKDWKKDRFDRKCDHCGGKGHTKDGCFKLIGYPEWHLKMKKNGDGHKGPRLAAQINADLDDSPFDIQMDEAVEVQSNANKMNPAVLNSIKQEVLKAIKEESNADDGYTVMENCAGPI